MTALPPEIAEVFDAWPGDVRAVLVRLRALIFTVAEETGALPVDEVLRWGQPAYIAPKGATLRLGQAKTGEAALFVTCSSTLIEEFCPVAPEGTRFEGTRAVLFPDATIDEAALSVLIARALTYHRKVP